jgi:hypothetical protein
LFVTFQPQGQNFAPDSMAILILSMAVNVPVKNREQSTHHPIGPESRLPVHMADARAQQEQPKQVDIKSVPWAS